MRDERKAWSRRWANPVIFEPLERRLLLSGDLPSIESAAADNRGRIVLVATDDLDESTIGDSSVLVFTAGDDFLLGTADDVLVDRTVTYDAATREITVDAEVGVDERYRVVLDSSIITDTMGVRLDGEFTGVAEISGDGIEGGDYEFFTRPSEILITRFTTIVGIIDVLMFRQDTPLTVENFMAIANAAQWDNTFIHRTVEEFIFQGGAFEAVDGFPTVPVGDQILNEPGISNLRGTIAMAKLSGEPDSATNQWFFNLGDNSANLDLQNGGFTVFGEIIDLDGLAVMDALAAFMTVNAEGQDPALVDLPVIDPSVVDANGGIVTVADLIVISRIAILMEISSEPTDQIDTSGSVTVTNPNGDAQVRIFDLDGVGLPAPDQFMRVTFGANDRITRIELLDGLPDGRIGIHITGALSVGAIIDRRTGSGGEVAFIVSDSSVNSVFMRKGISGENLNGKVLPGQIMDPDIDGDGDFDDELALFVPEGIVQSFISRDGLAGDVVAPKINNVRIRGLTIESDFAYDDPQFPIVRVNAPRFVFDLVIDSEIRTNSDISLISAAEWLDNDGRQEMIRAATIRSIQIRGGAASTRGGDFEADVITTGQDVFGVSLGAVRVRGTIFGSDWEINGPVRRISIGGDASSWTADISGDVGPISGGVMRSVEFSAAGAIRSVKVRGWEGGSITAEHLRSLVTRRTLLDAGGFEADVTLTGPAPAPHLAVLGSLRVAGDLNGSTFDISGDLRSMLVRGVTTNVDLDVRGVTDSVRLEDAFETTLLLRGGVGVVRAVSWIGGGLSAASFGKIQVLEQYDADLSANTIELLHVIRGDFSGTVNVLHVVRMNIGGDLVDATINFNESGAGRPFGVEHLSVQGEMRDTEINSSRDLGTIIVGAMSGSNIHVGFNFDMIGFPDDGSDLMFESSIERLEIRGLDDGSASMISSFVVAGRIGQFIITEPATDNFGQPFGVSAGTIDSSMVTIGNTTITVNTLFNPNSEAVGDFQVRFGFAPPPIA